MCRVCLGLARFLWVGRVVGLAVASVELALSSPTWSWWGSACFIMGGFKRRPGRRPGPQVQEGPGLCHRAELLLTGECSAEVARRLAADGLCVWRRRCCKGIGIRWMLLFFLLKKEEKNEEGSCFLVWRSLQCVMNQSVPEPSQPRCAPLGMPCTSGRLLRGTVGLAAIMARNCGFKQQRPPMLYAQRIT